MLNYHRQPHQIIPQQYYPPFMPPTYQDILRSQQQQQQQNMAFMSANQSKQGYGYAGMH